jgi:hypothetical protein
MKESHSSGGSSPTEQLASPAPHPASPAPHPASPAQRPVSGGQRREGVRSPFFVLEIPPTPPSEEASENGGGSPLARTATALASSLRLPASDVKRLLERPQSGGSAAVAAATKRLALERAESGASGILGAVGGRSGGHPFVRSAAAAATSGAGSAEEEEEKFMRTFCWSGSDTVTQAQLAALLRREREAAFMASLAMRLNDAPPAARLLDGRSSGGGAPPPSSVSGHSSSHGGRSSAGGASDGGGARAPPPATASQRLLAGFSNAKPWQAASSGTLATSRLPMAARGKSRPGSAVTPRSAVGENEGVSNRFDHVVASIVPGNLGNPTRAQWLLDDVRTNERRIDIAVRQLLPERKPR